ncbi:MAG TPA: metallophosphoesterase [Acidisphaera sp.]|nr:metallophosphoesterase [Acidisphaera sp.]
MGFELPTVRDHFLSVFQSAASETARQAQQAGTSSGLERAAAQIAAQQSQGVALKETPPPTVSASAWTCARLGFDLLRAVATGDHSRAAQLRDELVYGTCDPNWARTLLDHAGLLGNGGARDTIPYVRAATVGNTVLPMKPGATVAVIADWGTGTGAALRLLQEVAEQKPDLLIHLGDIYYSGTPAECEANFRVPVDRVFDRAHTKLPVFTLVGNHDMYSGGEGYYGLIKTLNEPPMRQPASFFCLRATDNSWQLLAMDTGLHDYDPENVVSILTYLEQDEEDWLTARLAEFPGRTILLSHHQLFSALSQIGPAGEDGSLDPVNPKLAKSYQRFVQAARKPIAAWFWGHEHALTVYAPYAGLEKGRCIGCGAVPVFSGHDETDPLAKLRNPPPLLPAQLGREGDIYTHGFTVLRLGADGTGRADYFQDHDGSELIFSESL